MFIKQALNHQIVLVYHSPAAPNTSPQHLKLLQREDTTTATNQETISNHPSWSFYGFAGCLDVLGFRLQQHCLGTGGQLGMAEGSANLPAAQCLGWDGGIPTYLGLFARPTNRLTKQNHKTIEGDQHQKYCRLYRSH